MNKPIFRLFQIYLLLLLLATVMLSQLPFIPLALILLLVMLFVMVRPLARRFEIAVMVAVIFTLPLLLQSILLYLVSSTETLTLLWLQFLAAIVIIPVIYLLDYNLRQNAQDVILDHNIKRRHFTPVSRALSVSTLIMLLLSFVLDNHVLLFISIILILYLMFILVKVLRAVQRLLVDVPLTAKRIIAGTTADISLYAMSKSSIRLYCLLSPIESWVKITPRMFILNGARIELNLIVTPPLAGPSHPQLRLSIMDSRGFVQVSHVIEPLELQVIPRAKYAEWLAMKYLEQNRAGTTIATKIPSKVVPIPKRGIEYFESRIYQPGDELRHIDWKRVSKFSELIVKEYIEAGEQSTIIAVNLSVADVEEADKLAFKLITTALTMAQEAIPAALAVYNHRGVVLTTAVTDSREILKQALQLVEDITLEEFAHRFLQLPDISKLRRNIAQLKQTTSEPGQRLLNMLNFEYKAIERAAKNNPATFALSRVIEHISPPAIIVLVSSLNHDTEALLVTSEKFTRRGFTTLSMEVAKP